MLLELLLVLPFLGGALGHAVERRESPAEKNKNWKPITQNPHFFNIKVDENYGCGGLDPSANTIPCFDGYAIRLENGIVIATPYDRWWDAKLPTMFVDEDTHLYTVSKDPLQLYVDSVTGALKYTKVGWVPPTAIAENFFHTSSNPLQIVGQGVSLLSWPLTPGFVEEGIWNLCKLGITGQFQVYVNPRNFQGSGPIKDGASCFRRRLAAVNANPWKKQNNDDWEDDEWSEDEEEEKKWPAKAKEDEKKWTDNKDDTKETWSEDDDEDKTWSEDDDAKTWSEDEDEDEDEWKA